MRKIVLTLLLLAITIPVLAKESSASLSLTLSRPSAKGWVAVPCGSSISGVGNIRVAGHALSPGSHRIRVGYGATEVAESWYVVGNYQLPATLTQVVDVVQDLTPSESAHTFRLTLLGQTQVACTITATDIPTPSEGHKSLRQPAVSSASVDLQVFSYKTGTHIPCGTVGPAGDTGRLLFTVRAQTATSFHLHLHNELPSGNGPDQDGDPSTRRFWEGGFFHLIPSGDVANGVNGADAGLNTFHAGQQAATPDNPTRVHPEAFCSVTN